MRGRQKKSYPKKKREKKRKSFLGLCAVLPLEGTLTTGNYLTSQLGKIGAVQWACRLFWSWPIWCRGGWTVIEDVFGDEGGMWSQVSGHRSCSLTPKLIRPLAIMNSVSCILALGLFSFALSADFHEGGNLSDVRLQRRFGSDEQRRSVGRSELSKRSAGLNEQTCTALPGAEAALQNNTHSVSPFSHL